jgi:hypothetical protein
MKKSNLVIYHVMTDKDGRTGVMGCMDWDGRCGMNFEGTERVMRIILGLRVSKDTFFITYYTFVMSQSFF